jgi:hypothetical protein
MNGQAPAMETEDHQGYSSTCEELVAACEATP